MADFVAVIRRAVDGLATNTPETRAKVYDKARGAVQRQLENMKPRPPEDMLRRQMDKLEAAIIDVEGEHAEALPDVAEEAAPVATAAAVEQAPVYEPAVPDAIEEPAAHDQAVYEAPAETEAEAVHEEPAYHAEAHGEQASHPYDAHATDAAEEHHDAAYHEEPSYHEEPAAYHEEAVAEAEPVAPAPYEHPAEPEWAHAQVEADHEVAAQHAVLDEPAAPAHDPRYGDWHDEEVAVHHQPETEEPHHPPVAYEQPADEWHAAAPAVDEAAPVAEWSWQQDAPQAHPAPAAASSAGNLDAVWDDVPELPAAGPVEPIHPHHTASEPVAQSAHFDEEQHVAANVVRMPAASSLHDVAEDEHLHGAHAEPAHPDPNDPFADYLDSLPQTGSASAPPAGTNFAGAAVTGAAVAGAGLAGGAAAASSKGDDKDPWSDLEDLIGYNRDPQSAGAPASPSTARPIEDDDDDSFMAAPAKPYRATPKKKRSYAGLILGLAGVIVIAGGGYAAWVNRASLTGLFGGLTGSGSSTTPAATTPAASGNGSSSNTPASQPAQQQAATTPAPATNPAASSSNGASATAPVAAGQKFTQRLMPDGTETDEGPGASGGLAQNAEGQSVAQLNAPPATPSPASPAAPGAAATPAPAQNGAPAPTAPASGANPAATPAVAGQKMFLYEERIGQSAPTAIEGTVSWSLQREPGTNGKPPEPVVQGRISVPGRGLTALITFKRNTDASLPASHLVEIVFALPKDFEGGGIDSVQRIAMKQTEQDRGNALIAVPAKITDDFHMIALNDFPDALKTNLDLLKTRNWMDIPVAYRNGRRALFTLQKGPDGEKAFNDAIAEWATMGPAKGE